MQRNMESRTRRTSARTASLPSPLILKHEQRRVKTMLDTPPPTGRSSTFEAYSVQNATVSTPTSAQMPCTPISPRTSETIRTSSEDNAPPAELSLGSPMALHADSKIVLQNFSKLLEQHASIPESRTKRDIDSGGFADMDRSRKHRICKSDLIRNPFCNLLHGGIPLSYVKDNIVRASEKSFLKFDGSVVTIKGIPRSRAGTFAVRVKPRRIGASPFRVVFKAGANSPNSNGTTASGIADDMIPGTSKDTDSNDSVADVQMPLHVEVAVIRLPVLGRLLLSGYIFKGDSLEIEMPHPEVLFDVMNWAYTDVMPEKERIKIESCIGLFTEVF